MSKSKGNKIRRDIISLDKLAAKQRLIFLRTKSKLEKLKRPFIISGLKNKYEGKFYEFPNSVDNEKWIGYLYCIEVNDFFKAHDGIMAKGRSLTFEDMKSRGVLIITREEEFFSKDLKEISKEKFQIETGKIIANIKSYIK